MSEEERFGLTRITIEGYKSIRKVDIKLRNLNVLIGANGSGKSNFIGFFKFMNAIVEKQLESFIESQGGGTDWFLYFGQKNTQSINIKLTFNKLIYELTLIPTISNRFQIKYESTEKNPEAFNDGEIRLVTWQEPSNESNLNSNCISHDNLVAKTWRIYHFHDTSSSSKIKQPSNINSNEFLYSTGSNIAAYLYYLKLKEPKAYQLIVNSVQRVAPFFHDFYLEPLKLNSEMIRLKWKHKKDQESIFDVHQLSDGTLRFICLATLLLQPDLPSTILLDEPELGLHPYAVHLLAGMIKSAAQRTQVIVATQSVTLANCFKPEDIIVAEYKDNATELHRLKSEDLTSWLEDYRIGDLWEKNVIGGNPP